jgi:hypothetical protein
LIATHSFKTKARRKNQAFVFYWMPGFISFHFANSRQSCPSPSGKPRREISSRGIEAISVYRYPGTVSPWQSGCAANKNPTLRKSNAQTRLAPAGGGLLIGAIVRRTRFCFVGNLAPGQVKASRWPWVGCVRGRRGRLRWRDIGRNRARPSLCPSFHARES